MKSLLPIPFCVLALFLALAPQPAAAQETEAPAAVTVADPIVDTGVLELMVKPLTMEELDVEINGWMELLAAKTKVLADTEIAARTAEKEHKKKLLEDANTIRSEQTALIERLNIVLDSFKSKGGDTAAADSYIKVVSEIEIKRDDVTAAWVTVLGWLKSKDGGIRWGMNILKFLAIVFLFKILAGILGAITRKAVNRMDNASELLKKFFINTVRKVTFIIGLVIALGQLGIDIGPLLAGIGVIGFVIGFALQDSLANFASGIMLLVYRPYEIGDAVEAGGVTGNVKAMNLVSTTIMTFDNKVEVVPNNAIWGNVITNITGSDTRRVDMTFGIGYSDDIAKAQGILEDILNNHPKVLKDPAFVIKLHELADSSVNFIVRPWSKTSDYWDLYWDVTRSVKERFDAEGVSIPFPQRDVHLFQEATA